MSSIAKNSEFLSEVVADFKHWSKMSYWTLEEGIALLLGQDPEFVNWDIVKDYQEWPFATDLSLHYSKLRNLILRAVEIREVNEQNPPAIFLAWAESRGIEIPEGLKQLVEAIKGIKFSEMEDLLKIKDQEIVILQKRIGELEALAWGGFDENAESYAKELAIAVKARSN